ncbi:MAG: hypothetical protein IKF10_04685 [Lachnospiraceae bacterium]|nr:hypothetical protein [Clostridia bacterium]MBR3154280.1 hypothetical protein [Lachnospiraceae bacterium]
MKDFSREVTLICPTCGNDQFEALDPNIQDLREAPDETQLRCPDCGLTITKGDLIQENSEKIEIAADEMAQDVAKEFEKELAKALKKWK